MWRITTGGVYSLLVAIGALLLIGEAANVPTISAEVGVASILTMFIIAIVIVYSIRVHRRISVY